jgi:uncharacterized protein (TIGR02646 family)
MIRVRKSGAPAELAQSGYTCEAVRQALIQDGDQKCFICERLRDTDLQVEHLQSRTNYPELENDWNNLYIACDYCNKRKSSYHDDMLHPDQYDVEDLIEHHVDLMGEVAQFSSAQTTADVQSTIRLLSKVYNGARTIGKPRRVLEQLFWDNFKKEYVYFLKVVNAYLAGKPDAEVAVRELLDVKEEYLAFKYHIIKNNPVLMQTFQNDIVWNK